jgi:hypothetical protein
VLAAQRSETSVVIWGIEHDLGSTAAGPHQRRPAPRFREVDCRARHQCRPAIAEGLDRIRLCSLESPHAERAVFDREIWSLLTPTSDSDPFARQKIEPELGFGVSSSVSWVVERHYPRTAPTVVPLINVFWNRANKSKRGRVTTNAPANRIS